MAAAPTRRAVQRSGEDAAPFRIGVHILPPVSFNHRYAMPDKLFDCLQARFGVLIGPSPEMAGVVREHELVGRAKTSAPRPWPGRSTP